MVQFAAERDDLEVSFPQLAHLPLGIGAYAAAVSPATTSVGSTTTKSQCFTAAFLRPLPGTLAKFLRLGVEGSALEGRALSKLWAHRGCDLLEGMFEVG
jgi:hypothetical protein